MRRRTDVKADRDPIRNDYRRSHMRAFSEGTISRQIRYGLTRIANMFQISGRPIRLNPISPPTPLSARLVGELVHRPVHPDKFYRTPREECV